MSLFNWDNIIAKYNLANYKRSFVHWNFLTYLPDKTLHILSLPAEKINEIEKVQENLFPFDQIYISGKRYSDIVDKRKEYFITKWQRKGLLSWNYPEYKAYKNLTDQN